MNNDSYSVNKLIQSHYSLIHQNDILNLSRYDFADYQGMRATILVLKERNYTSDPGYIVECKLVIKEQRLYVQILERKRVFTLGEELLITYLLKDYDNSNEHKQIQIIPSKNVIIQLYVHRNKKFVIPDNYTNITLGSILNNYLVGVKAFLVLNTLKDYPISCTIHKSAMPDMANVVIDDFYQKLVPGRKLFLSGYIDHSGEELLYICNHNEFAKLYIPDDIVQKNSSFYATENSLLIPPDYVALKYSQMNESACYAGEQGLLFIFTRDVKKLNTSVIPIVINYNHSVTIQAKYKHYKEGMTFGLVKVGQEIEMMSIGVTYELCKVFIHVSRL